MRKLTALSLAPALPALLGAAVLGACDPGPAPCDTGAVHEAIAESGAVAPDLAFAVTYLECGDGFGWTEIQTFGEGATAFLDMSGPEIEVLDLGTAVCPTHAGLPAGVADRLAPEGSDWRRECQL